MLYSPAFCKDLGGIHGFKISVGIGFLQRDIIVVIGIGRHETAEFHILIIIAGSQHKAQGEGTGCELFIRIAQINLSFPGFFPW